MERSGQKVVVIGAGAAGLSAAVGLANQGHHVTVLERRSASCLRRRGANSPRERLYESTGRFPLERATAPETLRESESFRRQFPEAVVDVPARYFVSDASVKDMVPGWRELGVKPSDDPNDRSPISPTFRQQHALRTFRLQDRVIDRARLVETLHNQLRIGGGSTIFGAEAIGCRRVENQIATVFARTPYGLRRFSSDVVINAAGSRIQQVIDVLGSNVNASGFLTTIATPVVRCPWPFSIEPAVLQFFGPPDAPVLQNLRVAPIGRTRVASVSASRWMPVDDPDQIDHDLQSEHRDLLHLMAQGFDLLDLPEPREMSWCVKTLPKLDMNSIKIADTGLSRVLPASMLSGSANEFLCLPGKLRGIRTLRDPVCSMIDEFFQSQGRLAAA